MAPELQTLMKSAVQAPKVPIFFFQAANDYDISPSNTLSQTMRDVGKPYQMKIYPAYGASADDGIRWDTLVPLCGQTIYSVS